MAENINVPVPSSPIYDIGKVKTSKNAMKKTTITFNNYFETLCRSDEGITVLHSLWVFWAKKEMA